MKTLKVKATAPFVMEIVEGVMDKYHRAMHHPNQKRLTVWISMRYDQKEIDGALNELREQNLSFHYCPNKGGMTGHSIVIFLVLEKTQAA